MRVEFQRQQVGNPISFEWAWLRSPALASQPSTCVTREGRSYDGPVQLAIPLCITIGIGSYNKSTVIIGHSEDVFALGIREFIYKL